MLLTVILYHRLSETPLPPTTYARLAKAFRGAGQLEQPLVSGNPVSYRPKHNGVSPELLHGARSQLSAEKRGRWASDDSHRHHERGNRIGDQTALISPPQQTKAQLVKRNIGGILSSTWLPR